MEQNPCWEYNRSSDRQKKSHFIEPECSLQHSQEPATCAYLEPDKSSLCLSITRLEDPFEFYILIYVRLSK